MAAEGASAAAAAATAVVRFSYFYDCALRKFSRLVYLEFVTKLLNLTLVSTLTKYRVVALDFTYERRVNLD